MVSTAVLLGGGTLSLSQASLVCLYLRLLWCRQECGAGERCEGGVFSPAACQSSPGNCGLLLAAYPAPNTAVLQHIRQQALLVQVVETLKPSFGYK